MTITTITTMTFVDIYCSFRPSSSCSIVVLLLTYLRPSYYCLLHLLFVVFDPLVCVLVLILLLLS